jgi:hypothetical protein
VDKQYSISLKHSRNLPPHFPCNSNKYQDLTNSGTYDHRLREIGHPVRSAIHKPEIGRLVVGWVTASEYLLLYVF